MNRYDSHGNLKLSSLGIVKHENYGYGLALDSNGRVYISGASNWGHEPPTPCIWRYSYGVLKIWREFGRNTFGIGEELFFDSYGNIYVVGTSGNPFLKTKLMLAKFNAFGEREFVEYREDLYSGTDGYLDEQNKLFICGSRENYFGTLDAYFLKLNNTLYPEGRSVIINDGAISTSSQRIDLSISALNSDEMCFRNSSTGNWSQWQLYDSSVSFNIENPFNNTEYSIVVKFRNKNGESLPINNSIRYLVFPPLNPHITLNEGALNTTKQYISIITSVTNAEEMCFKNSSSLIWGAWQPYRYWTYYYLKNPLNNTEYTIIAKFRNTHGESKVASASILFYIPPSHISTPSLPPLNPSIIINDGEVSFNSTVLKLSLFATNADEMCLKIGDYSFSYWNDWEDFNSTKFVSIGDVKNGTNYLISVRFRNNNGATLPVNDSITYLAPDSFQDDKRAIDGTISFQFYFLIWSFIAMIIIVNHSLNLNKKNQKKSEIQIFYSFIQTTPSALKNHHKLLVSIFLFYTHQILLFHFF